MIFVHIFYTLSQLPRSFVSQVVQKDNSCSCSYYSELDWAGPFCSKWKNDQPPFCFLSGRSNASTCPGAVKWKNTSFYWTKNETICNMSSNKMDQYCTCKHYDEAPWVGPYCHEWESGLRFCYLSGGPMAKFCEGAKRAKQKDLYWTAAERVCNKSIRPRPQQFSLRERKPFTTTEVIFLCLYSLNILIGTLGNAWVVKNFATGDESRCAGSLFVIVLAMVDCVTSMLIPGSVIFEILYNFSGRTIWQLGRRTCQAMMFRPVILYSTSWLLLSICLERARAIFRPFSAKLDKRFIALTSAIILFLSFILTLHEGLTYRYSPNRHLYVNGTVYEYSECSPNVEHQFNFFAYAYSVLSLGLWIPMVLITIVYIFMYRKLKEQANVRQEITLHNSQSQMEMIWRTFTIVLLAFYICFLPISICRAFAVYCSYFKKDFDKEAFMTALTFAIFLSNTNSSLNPIIYSKLHQKIYKYIKQMIVFCTQKCSV